MDDAPEKIAGQINNDLINRVFFFFFHLMFSFNTSTQDAIYWSPFSKYNWPHAFIWFRCDKFQFFTFCLAVVWSSRSCAQRQTHPLLAIAVCCTCWRFARQAILLRFNSNNTNRVWRIKNKWKPTSQSSVVAADASLTCKRGLCIPKIFNASLAMSKIHSKCYRSREFCCSSVAKLISVFFYFVYDFRSAFWWLFRKFSV